MADSKPSVLLIGGLGFIGRHLAKHIHDNKLASEIRIVDKQLPQLAWLSDDFKDACSDDKFKQGDLSREATAEKLFTRPDGGSYDYVFNCGGDTRYNQDDEVYKARSFQLSKVAGAEAAKRGVKVYVELSTGAVYKPDGAPCKETAKLKPWLTMAKWKLEAEQELEKMEGLNLVVCRMANVYGRYCHKTIGTMLCMAQVYKYMGEEMKWLWTKDLKQNTVHAEDVAGALWASADWYVKGKKGWDESSMGKTPIFNIVDHSQTDQGTMASFIADIFSIKTGFHGTLVSQLAKVNLGSAVDEENDELLQPWSELLAKNNITRPGPINPYLEGEVVKDSDMSLDGSRLETVVGYKYKYPQFTKERLEEMLESFRELGWWPEIPAEK